jgi:deazaflavin-dependent oxidoreductase (nitroreductase family)
MNMSDSASRRPVVTDKKPTGLLRWALRLPIWLFRAHLGFLFGHRLAYLAHRGRKTGARREVVVEVVRYDAGVPEFTVIAAWGGTPDWYRNLRAAPAIEVRIGRHRWPAPVQRFLTPQQILDLLHDYQRAHPKAFGQLGPRLGFPADPQDPAWPEVAARVHAIAFRPAA